MTNAATDPILKWLKVCLALAALYNVLWGAWVILFPMASFELAGLPTPNYPEIWQCIGMIVGVYGVGYAIAATNPYRHWPIVLVGLMGKLLGPAGFVMAYCSGKFNLAFALNIITNDLIWWVPFAMVLFKTYRFYHLNKQAL